MFTGGKPPQPHSSPVTQVLWVFSNLLHLHLRVQNKPQGSCVFPQQSKTADLERGDPYGKQTLWKASRCSGRMSEPKSNVSRSWWWPKIGNRKPGAGDDRWKHVKIQQERQGGWKNHTPKLQMAGGRATLMRPKLQRIQPLDPDTHCDDNIMAIHPGLPGDVLHHLLGIGMETAVSKTQSKCTHLSIILWASPPPFFFSCLKHSATKRNNFCLHWQRKWYRLFRWDSFQDCGQTEEIGGRNPS